ncbi:MAG: hypothetical protein GY871_07150 [Actinomycetales bacterium]|nr:hypothetical protein [Actinomycetales bacterium]
MKAGADSVLIETTGVGVDDEEPDAGFDGLLVQFADSGQRLGNRRNSSIASGDFDGDLDAVAERRGRAPDARPTPHHQRLLRISECSVDEVRESSEFVIDVE